MYKKINCVTIIFVCINCNIFQYPCNIPNTIVFFSILNGINKDDNLSLQNVNIKLKAYAFALVIPHMLLLLSIHIKSLML